MTRRSKATVSDCPRSAGLDPPLATEEGAECYLD